MYSLAVVREQSPMRLICGKTNQVSMLELDFPHVFLSCGEGAVTYEIDLWQDKPNKYVFHLALELDTPRQDKANKYVSFQLECSLWSCLFVWI